MNDVEKAQLLPEMLEAAGHDPGAVNVARAAAANGLTASSTIEMLEAVSPQAASLARVAPEPASGAGSNKADPPVISDAPMRTLPPISHPKVAAAAREYQRLAADYNEQQRGLQELKLNDLSVDAVAAREAATSAAARAIRGGTAVAPELEDEVATAERHVEALKIAVADASAELDHAIDRHREAWHTKLDAQVTEQGVAVVAAVDGLARALEGLAGTRDVKAWLDGFPRSDRWPLGRPRRVPGLPSPETFMPYESATVQQVLNALRALGAQVTR